MDGKSRSCVEPVCPVEVESSRMPKGRSRVENVESRPVVESSVECERSIGYHDREGGKEEGGGAERRVHVESRKDADSKAPEFQFGPSPEEKNLPQESPIQ